MVRLLVTLAILGTIFLLARSAFIPRHPPSPTDTIAEAQAWLLRHQCEDGLWRADAPDPCRKATIFEVDEALTALALVALEGNDAAREARERGVRALLAAQNADGGFGRPGSAKRRFNWILATWALVRLAPGEEGTRRGLKRIRAETLTRSLDDCEAGWVLLALHAARERGIAIRSEAEQAALETLEEAVKSRRHTTEAVPAMLARFGGQADVATIAESDDLHLLFFSLPSRRVDAPAVVRYLLGGQATSGCAKGSWAPDPWWGTAGGRVYATATAILILREASAK